jgi:hypothetical protein
MLYVNHRTARVRWGSIIVRDFKTELVLCASIIARDLRTARVKWGSIIARDLRTALVRWASVTARDLRKENGDLKVHLPMNRKWKLHVHLGHFKSCQRK